MASTLYRIPDPPIFPKATVQAWWTHNPETHLALGYCPQHQRRVLINPEDHEYGRQPSCALCGSWLTTLDLVPHSTGGAQ